MIYLIIRNWFFCEKICEISAALFPHLKGWSDARLASPTEMLRTKAVFQPTDLYLYPWQVSQMGIIRWWQNIWFIQRAADGQPVLRMDHFWGTRQKYWLNIRKIWDCIRSYGVDVPLEGHIALIDIIFKKEKINFISFPDYNFKTAISICIKLCQ